MPEKLISDNPKCFSIEASKYEPILNIGFERFCQHYNTIPEILPPYDPKKKGKVERIVPYVRRLFESSGEWAGIHQAQEFPDGKLKLANKRTHGTTRLRPIEVFLSRESSELEKLPPTSFEIEEYAYAGIRKDGCVRFRNKYSSVGKEHIGKKAFLIGGKDNVKIYIKGELIETHIRIRSSFQSKSIKKHHMEPFERIINDGSYHLKKAVEIGPYAELMIKTILLFGRGFVDTRQVRGILHLVKDYPKSQVENACKNAYECEQISYRSVLSFLNLLPVQENIKPMGENKFIRKTKEYFNGHTGCNHQEVGATPVCPLTTKEKL